MEKYVRFKASNSNQPLKYVVNLADKRPINNATESASVDATPKSLKPSKLEPLESIFSSTKYQGTNTMPLIKLSPGRRFSPEKRGISPERKLSPERRFSPEKKHPKKAMLTAKAFYSPNRTWRMLVEGEITPIDDKQTLVNTKFGSTIKGALEQDKQFTTISDQPPTLQGSLTTKAADCKEQEFRFTVTTPFRGGEQEKNRPISSEPRLSLTRNLSLPSFKVNQRKVVNKLSIAERNKSENKTSIEANKKVPPNQDVLALLPYRRLIFNPILDVEVFKNHLMEIHKGLVYSTQNLRSPSEKFIRSKQLFFPDSLTRQTKTLLLDLDETLVHGCHLKDKDKPDVVLTYQPPGEPVRKLPLRLRPYLKEFIARMSPLYEIAIFTASAAPYAEAIVDYIDPDRRIIHSVLTRENCMETKNGFFIKDLRIIKNRQLKDIVLVDNLAHSFGFQIDNGIPILEFTDNKKDVELRYLADYLVEAYNCEDLREFNKNRLKLKDIAIQKAEDLLEIFAGL